MHTIFSNFCAQIFQSVTALCRKYFRGPPKYSAMIGISTVFLRQSTPSSDDFGPTPQNTLYVENIIFKIPKRTIIGAVTVRKIQKKKWMANACFVKTCFRDDRRDGITEHTLASFGCMLRASRLARPSNVVKLRRDLRAEEGLSPRIPFVRHIRFYTALLLSFKSRAVPSR